VLLKGLFGIEPMEEYSGGGDGYAGEAEAALSAGLFDEATGAAAGLPFCFGCHWVGLVEDGGEVIFVEAGCGDWDQGDCLGF